jgi:hypothetical protein
MKIGKIYRDAFLYDYHDENHKRKFSIILDKIDEIIDMINVDLPEEREEGAGKMKYPTIEQVEKADVVEIARWHRFLSSPTNDSETIILNKVCNRIRELGGVTPEVSKKIGWSL